MAQCAALLDSLYKRVKVLDRSLPKTRTGRIWPYIGDSDHPAVLYDYTPTRERAGPEKFLKGYRGNLQADAYSAYDHFFTAPQRGLVEVGCWAHTRRHFHDALETEVHTGRRIQADQPGMEQHIEILAL